MVGKPSIRTVSNMHCWHYLMRYVLWLFRLRAWSHGWTLWSLYLRWTYISMTDITVILWYVQQKNFFNNNEKRQLETSRYHNCYLRNKVLILLSMKRSCTCTIIDEKPMLLSEDWKIVRIVKMFASCCVMLATSDQLYKNWAMMLIWNLEYVFICFNCSIYNRMSV